MATTSETRAARLAAITQRARQAYAASVAGTGGRWWTAVVLTASSARQAERYRREIEDRLRRGALPKAARYLVVADPSGHRVGSGGATLNAMRELVGGDESKGTATLRPEWGDSHTASTRDTGDSPPRRAGVREEGTDTLRPRRDADVCPPRRAGVREEGTDTLRPRRDADVCPHDWWAAERVLMIHSGGDSRRLPQYSLSGKLFSALPVRTPWGEHSTVFDEFLAHSTLWAEQMENGLLVASGDVVLVIDPESLDFSRTGATGVAMPQPAEAGTQHGVYVLGPDRAVYAFLQKPSLAEVKTAGGELPGGEVALDTGLLHFDPQVAGRLTEFAASIDWRRQLPQIDLYVHFTLALTGQWRPSDEDPHALRALARTLEGTPLSACLADGDFTHIGTTTLFRRLMTEDSDLTRLYTTKQRLGVEVDPAVRSSGVIVDSVLGSGSVGTGAVVLECRIEGEVRAARGSVLHGLDGIEGVVEAPEDAVLHQVPVRLSGGARAVVIRTYGVGDNPKDCLADGATWFGRPMIEVLEGHGMKPEEVWPGTPPEARCLWNARLFPAAEAREAWAAAQWMLDLECDYSEDRWRQAERFSLATSTECADEVELLEARARRARAQWEGAAARLALEGADIRPMLTQSPGLASLSATAWELEKRAKEVEDAKPTEAASLEYRASLFFAQAGLEKETEAARERAFTLVARAVDRGVAVSPIARGVSARYREVTVSAPARIDFGGGWSDTPPFCLDWGGTVLNAAVALNGDYPIETRIRRIDEKLVRCRNNGAGPAAEYRTVDQLLAAPAPGDAFAIPRSALQMSGLIDRDKPLEASLERLGGGLEIITSVRLPMGSGLGTSSILAATTLAALYEMLGLKLEVQELSDRVMDLEQYMSTGGGWQDQAGGIFPGVKLLSTGPGLKQRLRAEELALTRERLAELHGRLVLAYTGITRVAKGLLQEVVGGYLARETHIIEVLHSIKTLALEMAYAMEGGEWDHLGELLDRHWQLNQRLDPNTTNAPIEAMLAAVGPYVSGAKLAGAGGGGFLMLVARGEEDAKRVKETIEKEFARHGAAVFDWSLAGDGLRTRRVAG